MKKKQSKKYADEVNLEDYNLRDGKKMSLGDLEAEFASKRNKEAVLNMRMDPDLVEWLKKQAVEEGLPYQSYIHRKLTLLKNHKLIESNELEERVKQLERKILKRA